MRLVRTPNTFYAHFSGKFSLNRVARNWKFSSRSPCAVNSCRVTTPDVWTPKTKWILRNTIPAVCCCCSPLKNKKQNKQQWESRALARKSFAWRGKFFSSQQSFGVRRSEKYLVTVGKTTQLMFEMLNWKLVGLEPQLTSWTSDWAWNYANENGKSVKLVGEKEHS